ncbi:hypothetical protein PTTG_25681 [Puccinia triticina 1-1 BBBD Race 1]|uniref:Retrotransposon gag domain-containing protein n=1 Tax=Puccinia triticina (isolate 1-1 / race 1 (BBBD)) TaxID=630390 RepID=A0A180H146_PUCT1|nr:hypothetical protein PTTG_25681 [Puccinia triticina 1-1 BBBD Race 1]
MSDVSEINPITLLRNSPRFSPSPPPVPPLLNPNSQHVSPLPNPFPNPSSSSAPEQSVPTGVVGQSADDLSTLLANLRVDNSSQSTLLQAQAASIALLNAQARQDKQSISLLQSKTKNIKDVFHNELLKAKSENLQSLAHLRGLLEGSNEALGGRVGNLELANTHLMTERPRIFIEPPHQSHIYFTGAPKETNNFCFTMRNAFERFGEQFNTEKQKILWISGYFRAGSGQIEGEVPSYTWWRGLLSNNAAVLSLPALKASAKMEYVIAELQDVDSFIDAIERTFANHHELEEAEAAFYAACQGTKTIEEFNILFNSLLCPLVLDDRSKCKAYNKAIDQNLVKLALIRGPWNELVDLEAKQEIAVSVARNVSGVTKILDPKCQPLASPDSAKADTARTTEELCAHSAASTRAEGNECARVQGVATLETRPDTKANQSRSNNQPIHPPPRLPQTSSSQPQARMPDGDAMDVDEVSAAARDTGFSYAEFRQECVDRNICI